MSALAASLAGYARHHRKRATRATHALGVPAILFSLLVLFALARTSLGGVEISLALLVAVEALGGYLWLDLAIGAALVFAVVPLLVLAELLARGPLGTSLTVAALFFVGGWLLQLVGHRVEGNRPALVDDLRQALVAPAFLAAELLFALGLRQELQRDVERRLAANDARATMP